MQWRLEALLHTLAVVVVTGARQVGKTTLLRGTMPHVAYEVLDPTQGCRGAPWGPELWLANHPALHHRRSAVCTGASNAMSTAAAKRALGPDSRVLLPNESIFRVRRLFLLPSTLSA